MPSLPSRVPTNRWDCFLNQQETVAFPGLWQGQNQDSVKKLGQGVLVEGTLPVKPLPGQAQMGEQRGASRWRQGALEACQQLGRTGAARPPTYRTQGGT